MTISNKTILIIGGGGLLGGCLISSIIQSGGNVIAVDKDFEHMQSQLLLRGVSLDSSQLELFSLDITNESDTVNFYKSIQHLDGVVNCSYPRNSNYGSSFFNVSLDSFNENISMHLGSAFLIMRESAAYFKRNKKQFSLVNIGSIYGSSAPDFSIYDNTGMTMPVEYAAIKSAIIHMNKYVAQYVSDSTFRINSVSPGGLLADQPEVFQDAYKNKTLGHGMIMPEDVIGAIIFLLSDTSHYINGQNILIDDGFSL